MLSSNEALKELKHFFCISLNKNFSCFAVFVFLYTFKSSVPHEVKYPTTATAI